MAIPYPNNNQVADMYDTRIGAGPLPNNIWGSANRAYVRSPQQDELVESRLQGLLRPGNRYVDAMRNRAAATANASGNANSGMAAALAENAALLGAMPIAQSDAEAYRAAQAQNQQVLNDKLLSDNRLSEARASAGRQASAMINAAQIERDAQLRAQRERLDFEGEQRGLDRTFDWDTMLFGDSSTNNRMILDNLLGGQRDVLGANLQLRNTIGAQDNQGRWNMRGQQMDIFSNLMDNQLNRQYAYIYAPAINHMMSDPDYFSDPEAVSGMMNFLFSNQPQGFDDIFGAMFGLFDQYI